MKYIFIVNGKPTSGKDTFAGMILKKMGGAKYSIIDPVKELLLNGGVWDGKTKSPEIRKLMSDVKILLDEFCDYSYGEVRQYIKRFQKDEIKGRVLFIDMREKHDIERAVKEFGAATIYVENANVEIEPSNIADDFASNKDNYPYDIVIDNSENMEALERKAEDFANVLKSSDGDDYDA